LPLLFAIFLEIIVVTSLEDIDIGAWINGHRLTDLQFADDIALLAESEISFQEALSSLWQNSKQMEMKINVAKTETQLLGYGSVSLSIELEGQDLKHTDKFVYLGGVMNSVEGTEADVKRRIGIARGIFQMLSKIWTQRDLSKALKTEVFEVMVISALLYNSETWVIKAATKNRLKAFKMACLRKIVGVTKRDRIRNTEIPSRLNWQKDIIKRIQQRRLKYFGHVARMNTERYPYMAFYGQVQGTRRKGRQKKRWVDTIKQDCKEMHLKFYDAIQMTQNRQVWRKSVEELLTYVDPTSPRH